MHSPKHSTYTPPPSSSRETQASHTETVIELLLELGEFHVVKVLGSGFESAVLEDFSFTWEMLCLVAAGVPVGGENFVSLPPS